MVPGSNQALSEVQKRCLTLVSLNRTSKEIAVEVGLSPMTVDQYLSRATSLLGAANRRDAARIFIQSQVSDPFKQLEFKPETVAEQQNSANVEPTQAETETPRNRWSILIDNAVTWTVSRFGGAPHDLTKLETVRAILWTALAATGILAAIITVGAWLNHKA